MQCPACDMSSIDKCSSNIFSNELVDWLGNSFFIFFLRAWSICRPMDNLIGCFLNKNAHLLSASRDAEFFNTAIPFNCLGAVIILWLLNTSQRAGAEHLEGLIGNQSSRKAYGGRDVNLCWLCSWFLCSRLNNSFNDFSKHFFLCM